MAVFKSKTQATRRNFGSFVIEADHVTMTSDEEDGIVLDCIRHILGN